MEPFKTITAVAMPLPVPNADTDQIIPARFLWHRQSDGYGQWLFNDLRFSEDGGKRKKFVLNDPRYAGAKILIGDRNFGCGSSREQAVWALYDYGFRAVIAPSFGDIFFNNSFKQGLLAVVLPEAEMTLLREAARHSLLTVDLEAQVIIAAGLLLKFAIAPHRRAQLLGGLDEIAMTLGLAARIAAFEAGFDQRLPG